MFRPSTCCFNVSISNPKLVKFIIVDSLLVVLLLQEGLSACSAVLVCRGRSTAVCRTRTSLAYSVVTLPLLLLEWHEVHHLCLPQQFRASRTRHCNQLNSAFFATLLHKAVGSASQTAVVGDEILISLGGRAHALSSTGHPVFCLAVFVRMRNMCVDRRGF